jgi:hypothetical protein
MDWSVKHLHKIHRSTNGEIYTTPCAFVKLVGDRTLWRETRSVNATPRFY